MQNNSENILPNRKPTRLKGYDYSVSGYYFITICSKDKAKIFGSIVGGGAHDAPNIALSKIGETVNKYILSSNNIPEITVDKYVIMPNHIHLILRVDNTNGTSRAPNGTSRAPNGTSRAPNGTSRAPSPTNNIISHTVSTLKRFINKEIGQNVFQRSFYDHIIRGELDYMKICEYIDNNPAKWKEDELYK